MKKDILFLCQFFYPEYISSAVLPFDTAKALHQAGFSVEVLCGYPREYSDREDVYKRQGFLSMTAKTMTDTEVKTLAMSCFDLTAELATRFLADYLDGDLYFNIRRPDHNLVRARCQIALAKDMLKHMDEMEAIVEQCVRNSQ